LTDTGGRGETVRMRVSLFAAAALVVLLAVALVLAFGFFDG
jgi:nitrate reductase NapE component